jgi:hypothetical protein
MADPRESDEEKGGLPRDLTKRILTLGLGAYFLTEDTVRRYVKDAKLPRDVAKSITQNAVKGKDELYGFVARELSNFLEKMDLQEELGKFVQNHKVKIKAEIEFVPRQVVAPPNGDDEEDSDDEESEETSASASDSSIEWTVSFGSSGEHAPLSEPEND